MAPLSLDPWPELLRCSPMGMTQLLRALVFCALQRSSDSLGALGALILPIHKRCGGDRWAKGQCGAGPCSATYGSSRGLVGGAGNQQEAGQVPRGRDGVRGRKGDHLFKSYSVPSHHHKCVICPQTGCLQSSHLVVIISRTLRRRKTRHREGRRFSPGHTARGAVTLTQTCSLIQEP